MKITAQERNYRPHAEWGRITQLKKNYNGEKEGRGKENKLIFYAISDNA
ncbi:MAG: hypothetical protein H8E32_10995 [Nitrospinae bacterium]|nr:hypothetical protein [Nitrospinota bacterium]